ncbi:hypothetical protein, partial [Kitasatospora putterlickiae]
VGAARPAAAQQPTEEQLRAALLTAAELGPDFTEIPLDSESPSPEAGASASASATASASPSAGPSAGASPLAGCDALYALLNGEVTEELPTGAQGPYQEVQFEGQGGYPWIAEYLSGEDPGKLDAELATVDSAFTDCHSIDLTSDDGQKVTFSVERVALGDRQGAPAVRIAGAIAGVPLYGYLGIERLGADVALGYWYFLRGADDAEGASVYYRAAVAKAERSLEVVAGSTTAPGTAA